MQGKTCLVTGANTGIGKETARELAARGAQVIMVCRNREKGEAALGDIVETTGNENVVLLLADLASLEQVRSLGAQVNRDYPRLDVLINNAGLQLWERHVTPDGYEETFAVNHPAPFLLTHLLLPSLQAAGTARIVNVSSGMHWGGRIHLNDLMRERRYSSSKVYAQTKLANVLFTYELARRLEGSGITVNTLSPGMVRSEFFRDYGGVMGAIVRSWRVFMVSPQKGAETSVYLAASLEVEGLTGRYFVKSKAVKSSRASRNRHLAGRLWQVSAELTGLDPQAIPEREGS